MPVLQSFQSLSPGTCRNGNAYRFYRNLVEKGEPKKIRDTGRRAVDASRPQFDCQKSERMLA